MMQAALACLAARELGIYGDFLIGDLSRYGRTALEAAAGPVLGTIADVDELRRALMRGEDRASEALRLALNNTPFLNLFYTRIALDYLFLYSIQEALNPGYLRRMERRIERENNQEFWLRPVDFK